MFHIIVFSFSALLLILFCMLKIFLRIKQSYISFLYITINVILHANYQHTKNTQVEKAHAETEPHPINICLQTIIIVFI